MIRLGKHLTDRSLSSRLMQMALVLATILLSALLAPRASLSIIAMLGGLGGLALIASQPVLGLAGLILAALIVPVQLRTGTDVTLNAAFLMVPVILVIWVLDMLVRQRALHVVHSRTSRPLLIFLLSGIASLLIGNALWDPTVPRSNSFLLVQLAQWAIFAFSAAAFWLAGNLVRNAIWLRRLSLAFLVLGNLLLLLRLVPGGDSLIARYATSAINWPPFIALLVALEGGQLLFNRRLSQQTIALLLIALFAAFFYAFFTKRAEVSSWLSVAIVIAILLWLRYPNLRWVAVAIAVLLVLTGVLVPAAYEFAGGDAEWTLSGGSRQVLIERVIRVTLRNPITGLGPAAYRLYANMEPLFYQGAYWVAPRINSHNNYVDLFAQVGIVGLGVFLWFMVEIAWLGARLRHRFEKGFAAGYVNAMLAVWVAMLVGMLLLDWFLPFVYNAGFNGFQASVLVWLFMGGLVSIENWRQDAGEVG